MEKRKRRDDGAETVKVGDDTFEKNARVDAKNDRLVRQKEKRGRLKPRTHPKREQIDSYGVAPKVKMRHQIAGFSTCW